MPLLLGLLPPAVAAVLYALVTGGLICEALWPLHREAAETLATPTKSVALLLVGGGTIALWITWPEPVRRSATLVLLSGVCLLWGYRYGRTKGPWILVVPCLLMTFSIAAAYVSGWSWAGRFVGSARLATVALLPAALVWSLITTSRLSVASGWFAVGLLYLSVLFLLADWIAVAAYASAVMIALVAVREDPEVPFLFAGLGLVLWLGLCLLALLPAGADIRWLPTSLTGSGAHTLLSAQSSLERIFGSNTWEKLWLIPRLPHDPPTSVQPWWQEYLGTQIASLGWLAVLLLVVLVITLFLISTPSRRARHPSYPVLWRFLAIGAWLVVAAPTNLWLVSPLMWLLVGGVLGLKEPAHDSETAGAGQAVSPSAGLLPAVMAALFVVPVVQSAREWHAEQLAEVQDRALSAARWAPWRADIVQTALESQLQRSPAQRDAAAISWLLSCLMRLESKKVAYEAQASLAAPTGSAAVASLASAVRASPRDRAIRRRYADALKALGLLEEARREYEACADLSPLDASLRIAIGSIWELLRREDLALSEYRKALALDPESNIAQLKVTDLSSRVAR